MSQKIKGYRLKNTEPYSLCTQKEVSLLKKKHYRLNSVKLPLRYILFEFNTWLSNNLIRGNKFDWWSSELTINYFLSLLNSFSNFKGFLTQNLGPPRKSIRGQIHSLYECGKNSPMSQLWILSCKLSYLYWKPNSIKLISLLLRAYNWRTLEVILIGRNLFHFASKWFINFRLCIMWRE